MRAGDRVRVTAVFGGPMVGKVGTVLPSPSWQPNIEVAFDGDARVWYFEPIEVEPA